MPDEKAFALASARLDQARECLRNAKMNLSSDMFKGAANRSYYCIFHAMRAVEALDRFDSRKHKGVISYFHRHYINTGRFPVELSPVISKAFKFRNDCDYNDFYLVSKDAVTAQVEDAKTFLAAVEEYLSRIAPEVVTANIKD